MKIMLDALDAGLDPNIVYDNVEFTLVRATEAKMCPRCGSNPGLAVRCKRQPRDRAGKAIPEVTTGPPRLARGFWLGGMAMHASPATAEPWV